jgi:enterochelin esterase family protein
MTTSRISLGILFALLFALPAVVRAEGDLLPSILITGEDWQVVADGIAFADGASADADGNFYFSDLKSKPPVIYKVAPDGKTKTKVAEIGMSGTKIGPDGKLYAVGGGKAVVVDLSNGKVTTLAENLKTNDIAINHLGQIYITETGKKQVTFLDAKTGQAKAADVGINKPNGIGFLPNQKTLLVSDYGGLNVYAFTVQADGSLTDKRPWATMHASEKKPTIAGGDGMTIDETGRAYVTTALGLQVFDPNGQLLGILPKPQEGALTNAAFAGEGRCYLYLTCGNKVFRRKTQVKGALTFEDPGAAEKR